MNKVIIFLILCSFNLFAEDSSVRPKNIVSLTEIDSSIIVEARYNTTHNFVGKIIDGYKANKCFLTKTAAKKLSLVQKDLLKKSLSLKVYDCYRPQKAVNHFMRWGKDLDDRLTEKEFYQHEKKSELFDRGYISKRSGHSRASTVDLTIVKLPILAQEEYIAHKNLRDCILPHSIRFKDNSINMGTGYDCFSELSHTKNPAIIGEIRKNRSLLLKFMKKHGFKNYSKEWWHFTLKEESYPDTYFDFDVK